jgi:DNA transposition AAA+ family ATPase
MTPKTTASIKRPINPQTVEALKAYQRTRNLSQRQLATRLGISPAYVSLALKTGAEFPGDAAGFEDRVESLIEQEAIAARKKLLVEVADGFLVDTMSKFLTSIAATQDIGIIYSPAGWGKTCGIAKYSEADRLAVVVTALKGNTGWRALRRAVLGTQNGEKRQRGETRSEVMQRIYRGSQRLLIIDNGHLLTESARQWLAYDWNEGTGCGVALVGNPEIVRQWEKNDQHASRVGLSFEVHENPSRRDDMNEVFRQFFPAAFGHEESLKLASRIVKGPGGFRALRKHSQLAKVLSVKGRMEPAQAIREANSILPSFVNLQAPASHE